MMIKKPTVLMILDGYGLNDKKEGNAVYLANKPVMDKITSTYPSVKGKASGLDVGLPDGQMGNSEVGHLNIGAGRVVYQELTRITKSIKDGDFFENPALLKAIDNCKANKSDLHLWGLLSDGGVHSHNEHLYALLELAKKEGLQNVYVHCFLDGRDTPPASGIEYVTELQNKMDTLQIGKIASVHGRYYAMDRDNRWDRVQLAYDALVEGIGQTANSGIEAVKNSYEQGNNDEFVLPTVVLENGKPMTTVKNGDSVIFFNFRPDRARELTRAFCDETFNGFERKQGLMELVYTCFTNYDITINNKEVAYGKTSLTNTLGEYISGLGKTQLRLAETEKYAHVTFFFNGGVEIPNPGEDRILVPSPKVATYDLQPEMSAYQVSDELVKAIKGGMHDLIIVNFANPDMVGHSGIVSAAVKAIETVDQCVGAAYEALKEVNGVMFICADHGNSEQLIDYTTHQPFTAHTINPVPFILVNGDPGVTLREGKLADIAPTLLDLMGIEVPEEMTGRSLLVKP
ncbi:phosphoglycerate mutase [Petrocella atlantisensis]|uniref:2,3-bisphosphoglycerate-independent phosphoglycerate mutase n=2 Tax=Petrocella atlantisensis TaxID=2173034 RepID=A0A3P7PZW4_9FIRM|nr:phosphoglycerate mutase [Petrocella atlantisensis]